MGKKQDCHERALGLLAVRPRSRHELSQRLLAARFEPTEVDEVLGRLERVGLIDDVEFARQFAEQRFVGRKAGDRVVASDLCAKGIAPETIEAVLAAAPDDEADRAASLANSRVGRLAGLEPKKAYSRLVSFLVRRGYGYELAREASRRALHIDGLD